MWPGIVKSGRGISHRFFLWEVLGGNFNSSACRFITKIKCFAPVIMSKRLSNSVLVQGNELDIENVDENPLKLRKNRADDKRRNGSHSKAITEYMLSKNDLVDLAGILPEKLLKSTRNTREALYIVEKDVAKEFVNAVKSVWNLDDDHIVLEANPGLGLITKELINIGVKKLLLYESCNNFQKILNELQDKYPDKIKVIFKDLFSISKLAYQDKMDSGSRVEEILSHLPKRQWTDDPAVKILGALSSSSFMQHLTFNIVFQTGLVMHGRPEIYLTLTPALLCLLTCGPEAGYFYYRSTAVLFQLFFESEIVTKLPRKSFFPWSTEYSGRRLKRMEEVNYMDPEFLYVLKIVPRKDLYEAVAPTEKLQPLWYFIRHHFLRRTNRVIPELERWIPGCGTRLVLLGMTVYTRFGDLTPQEVLSLFHHFSSWPEYPHSPFLASMETLFLKLEQTDEDADKDIIETDMDNLQSDVGDDEESAKCPQSSTLEKT